VKKLFLRLLLSMLVVMNVATATAEQVKVGVVGNSHMAALRLALSASPERYDSLKISFWGMPGGPMADLTRFDENGVISASGGANRALKKLTGNPLATLDPREFDVVIVYGFTLVLPAYFKKYANLAEDKGISDAMRNDILSEEISRRWAFQYAEKIRKLGKRVILYAAPYRSERIADDDDDQEQVRRYVPVAIEFAKRKAAEVGAEFYVQPPETVVDGYFTDDEFAASDTDEKHMNAAYGAIVLDDLAGIVRQ
jgi:hypothetical protein